MADSERLALAGAWDSESILSIDVVATMMSCTWQSAHKMKRVAPKNKSSATETIVKSRSTMKTKARIEVSKKSMVMVERVRVQV